ncbi:MAG: hypothetical protein IIC35_10095, partial [Gemmatimonadetes bacterium]|nr:hypothetical protein [Gemmatimonadota bacterium]
FQIDCKIAGVSREIMGNALEQARVGRDHILGKMNEALAAPRDDLSKYAPRITSIKIPEDKIRDIIGPGGKVIREIQASTGADINIEDDGKVAVAAADSEAALAAIEMIESITADAEVGAIYHGTVTRLMNFGAFGIVIAVAHQGEERLQVEDYAGFGWAQPFLGVLLTIFLLSLAGFPGTGGFMGKMYLLQGAADAQLWFLSVILVLTTVASYWYYLRVAWYMWMKPQVTEDQHALVVAPLPMRIALIASVGVVLYLGLFPGAVLEFARDSVQGLGALGGGMLGLGQ